MGAYDHEHMGKGVMVINFEPFPEWEPDDDSIPGEYVVGDVPTLGDASDLLLFPPSPAGFLGGCIGAILFFWGTFAATLFFLFWAFG
jgi:hypothetical protein